MSTPAEKVWFVTGCSSGFGRALAEALVNKGYRAVLTARDSARLADLAEGREDRVLALEMDVTHAGQIAAVVHLAQDKFGRIDVLVNNAGYGYQTSAEEGEDAQIRAQFETNTFGVFAVTRAVLPIMRRQRSGSIINMTSVSGLVGLPASGYYAASKHAVEGWADSLRAEVEPLGIGVTCVEPGPFRTDFGGRSLRQTPNRIAEYADTAGRRMASTKETAHTWTGDPVRASGVIIELVERSNLPRHLALGRMAYEVIVNRLQQRLDGIRAGQALSFAADDAAPPA